MIQTKEVIAIIAGDLVNESTILSEFVEMNTKNNNIVEISSGTVKSIVITGKSVYFSPFSAATLKRRLQYVSEFEVSSK